MPMTVRIAAGTRKARRIAESMGSVQSCKLMEGDSKPVYSPYGTLRRRGARRTECKLVCTSATRDAVRRYYTAMLKKGWQDKERGGDRLFHFDDRCGPDSLSGARKKR